MSKDKMDIFYEGKIYIDVHQNSFLHDGKRYLKAFNITFYPVQGSHQWNDGDEVTGKYSFEDIYEPGFGELSKRRVAVSMESFSQSQAVERFKFPTDKQIVGFAIVFNDGKIENEKLADMVAMCEMILHRLHENGDVTIPSKNENKYP
jgi:hypothetical protein